MSEEKNEEISKNSNSENTEIAETVAAIDPEAQLKAEVEEQRKQNLYLRADFENFRKQAIRERSELLKFGAEPLIREFLNVYDNLERAATTDVTPETLTTYKNGIELIVSQFKKALDGFGVEEVESLHKPFDPNLHEALTSEEDPDLPEGVITKVFKKGFKLHGKVIRPAQVVVNTASDKKG